MQYGGQHLFLIIFWQPELSKMHDCSAACIYQARRVIWADKNKAEKTAFYC
jgi:hypothetical protein